METGRLAQFILSMREAWGLISRPVKSDTVSLTTLHRCDVSSELCCSGIKQWRRAPPLVTRTTASITKIWFNFLKSNGAFYSGKAPKQAPPSGRLEVFHCIAFIVFTVMSHLYNVQTINLCLLSRMIFYVFMQVKY